MRHIASSTVVALSLACACRGAARDGGAQGTPARAADRPNIVVVVADDQGYGDLGVYGHPTIRTPNIDRMAAEGLKFTQFYAAAPLCTPSRAGFVTGRLPVRSGMAGDRNGVLFPDSPGGLPQSEITIAEALKDRGYATAAIGKWHLGDLPQYMPTEHGFDHYFGVPYSNDMDSPAGIDYRAAIVDENAKPETFNVPLLRDQQIIERPADQHTLTKRYTEEAVRFIRDNRARPFFLYLAHNQPHLPNFASPAFKGRSPRGLYGDAVEEVDWSVGQLLAVLRELSLDRRTLVVFTSDNGPWLGFGLGSGSAGLLRGGKGSTWEGGVREPTIAWWPGVIAPGGVSTALASNMDIFPTAVELAGGEVPRDREMDGVSLVPVLRGQREQVRDVLFYYQGTRLSAVRKGPWKAYVAMPPRAQPEGAPPPRAPAGGGSPTPGALYNLNADPSEQFDVAAANPAVLADLQREAERHRLTVKPVTSQLDLPRTGKSNIPGGAKTSIQPR